MPRPNLVTCRTRKAEHSNRHKKTRESCFLNFKLIIKPYLISIINVESTPHVPRPMPSLLLHTRAVRCFARKCLAKKSQTVQCDGRRIITRIRQSWIRQGRLESHEQCDRYNSFNVRSFWRQFDTIEYRSRNCIERYGWELEKSLELKSRSVARSALAMTVYDSLWLPRIPNSGLIHRQGEFKVNYDPHHDSPENGRLHFNFGLQQTLLFKKENPHNAPQQTRNGQIDWKKKSHSKRRQHRKLFQRVLKCERDSHRLLQIET